MDIASNEVDDIILSNPNAHFSEFISLIKDKKFTGDSANTVFATYLEYNSLDDATVKDFIAAGVDINARNMYPVDTRDGNALVYTAEYRLLSDMKVILENGGDVNTRVGHGSKKTYTVMATYLNGHRVDFLDIKEDEVHDFLEGVKLLITHGAILTEEEVNFFENELPKKDYLVEMIADLRYLV